MLTFSWRALTLSGPLGGTLKYDLPHILSGPSMSIQSCSSLSPHHCLPPGFFTLSFAYRRRLSGRYYPREPAWPPARLVKMDVWQYGNYGRIGWVAAMNDRYHCLDCQCFLVSNDTSPSTVSFPNAHISLVTGGVLSSFLQHNARAKDILR